MLLCNSNCFAQKSEAIDLHKLVTNNGIEVYNRQLTLLTEPSYSGIRLSKNEGEGVAWLKDVSFSTGVLEFDVRGENVEQHSFVGIAFHGVNDSTYDAIYLRPFHFDAEDSIFKARQIQYISLPQFTWRKLRENFPGKYENHAAPTPQPNAWFRVKVVINDGKISAYINNCNTPALIVKKLTNTKLGKLGFYVADTSGGDFANLTITIRKQN